MKKYDICTTCVMDLSAKDIDFDENGVCNYCKELKDILKNNKNKFSNIDTFIKQIKNDGKNKEYDCIVGVSGGVDSTYSLYLAKKHGLRVLAVHMDNGWNSELAVNNIKNIVQKLDIDLYTHVIEWEEYRKLMQAFFDADVIDVELLYDNAMLSVNYQLANKYGIKYILSGSNTSTEGMRMPENWNWNKLDSQNIINIAKRNNVKLKTFPSIGQLKLQYYQKIKKIKWIHFLDYIEYNKNECMNFLENEFGFKPYPYKHYESIFTRFYQGYILPNKFKVDKRRLHFSTMIITGQITREKAIKNLQLIPYPSEKDLENDLEYFLKKMEWSINDLSQYIHREEKSHLLYGSSVKKWQLISNLYKKLWNSK